MLILDLERTLAIVSELCGRLYVVRKVAWEDEG